MRVVVEERWEGWGAATVASRGWRWSRSRAASTLSHRNALSPFLSLSSLHSLTPNQGRSAIQWDVFICIGFAFAVSSAMEVSGVAAACASVFVKLANKIGGVTAPPVAMYMVSGLLTEIVTNNAGKKWD